MIFIVHYFPYASTDDNNEDENRDDGGGSDSMRFYGDFTKWLLVDRLFDIEMMSRDKFM